MTRLNFPYFMNETAVKYIIEAVKMVAREGWKLLPQVCILIRVCVCVSHCHVCVLYTMSRMYSEVVDPFVTAPAYHAWASDLPLDVLTAPTECFKCLQPCYGYACQCLAA